MFLDDINDECEECFEVPCEDHMGDWIDKAQDAADLRRDYEDGL